MAGEEQPHRLQPGQALFLTNLGEPFTLDRMVDGSGAVVERYVYDPYGAVTVYSPDYSTVRPVSLYSWDYYHQGLRWDGTATLYDNYNRWYSPSLGRFTSLELIGFSGGNINQYGYVGNNPTSWLDPTGMCSTEPPAFPPPLDPKSVPHQPPLRSPKDPPSKIEVVPDPNMGKRGPERPNLSFPPLPYPLIRDPYAAKPDDPGNRLLQSYQASKLKDITDLRMKIQSYQRDVSSRRRQIESLRNSIVLTEATIQTNQMVAIRSRNSGNDPRLALILIDLDKRRIADLNKQIAGLRAGIEHTRGDIAKANKLIEELQKQADDLARWSKDRGK